MARTDQLTLFRPQGTRVTPESSRLAAPSPVDGDGAALLPPIPAAPFVEKLTPVSPPQVPLWREPPPGPTPKPDGRGTEVPFSRRMSDVVRRLQLLERNSKGQLGLTPPQCHALHALRVHGSLKMQELALVLGLAQSTVTRLIAPLKRARLLDTRPDRDDGRATRVFLTEDGVHLCDDSEDADRLLYDRLLSRLPDGRRGEVVGAVELIAEALSGMES